MSGEFGTGKTIFVLAIVVGCFAVLWPKVFYPMLTASSVSTTSKTTVPKTESSGARAERPAHLHPDMMHPALRERGRALPVRTIDKEAKPGPMPGVRPPMGGGAGHISPSTNTKASSSMSIIMPLYTVGIIIFFIYTIMKVLFKKCPDDDDKTPKIKNFHMDPEYRKYVFEEEYLDSGDSGKDAFVKRTEQKETLGLRRRHLHDQPDRKIEDEQMDQLRRRLEDTERAMERLMAQMGTVSDKLTAAKITEVLSQAQTQAKLLKTTALPTTPTTRRCEVEVSSEKDEKQEREISLSPVIENKLKTEENETTADEKGGELANLPQLEEEKQTGENNKESMKGEDKNTHCELSLGSEEKLQVENIEAPQNEKLVCVLAGTKIQETADLVLEQGTKKHKVGLRINLSPSPPSSMPAQKVSFRPKDSIIDTEPEGSDDDRSSDATETGADVSELRSFAEDVDASKLANELISNTIFNKGIREFTPEAVMPKLNDSSQERVICMIGIYDKPHIPEIKVPKFADTPEVVMPKFDDTTEVVMPKFDDTPEVVMPNFDDTPEVVIPKFDDTPEVVMPKFDDTPEVVMPKFDDTPEVVMPKFDDTPEVVMPKFDDTPEVVMPKFDDTPEVVMPKFDGTPEVAMLKLGNTPEVVMSKFDGTSEVVMRRLGDTPHVVGQQSEVRQIDEASIRLDKPQVNDAPEFMVPQIDDAPEVGMSRVESGPELVTQKVDSVPELATIKIDDSAPLATQKVDEAPVLAALELGVVSALSSSRVDDTRKNGTQTFNVPKVVPNVDTSEEGILYNVLPRVNQTASVQDVESRCSRLNVDDTPERTTAEFDATNKFLTKVNVASDVVMPKRDKAPETLMMKVVVVQTDMVKSDIPEEVIQVVDVPDNLISNDIKNKVSELQDVSRIISETDSKPDVVSTKIDVLDALIPTVNDGPEKHIYASEADMPKMDSPEYVEPKSPGCSTYETEILHTPSDKNFDVKEVVASMSRDTVEVEEVNVDISDNEQSDVECYAEETAEENSKNNELYASYSYPIQSDQQVTNASGNFHCKTSIDMDINSSATTHDKPEATKPGDFVQKALLQELVTEKTSSNEKGKATENLVSKLFSPETVESAQNENYEVADIPDEKEILDINERAVSSQTNSPTPHQAPFESNLNFTDRDISFRGENAEKSNMPKNMGIAYNLRTTTKEPIEISTAISATEASVAGHSVMEHLDNESYQIQEILKFENEYDENIVPNKVHDTVGTESPSVTKCTPAFLTTEDTDESESSSCLRQVNLRKKTYQRQVENRPQETSYSSVSINVSPTLQDTTVMLVHDHEPTGTVIKMALQPLTSEEEFTDSESSEERYAAVGTQTSFALDPPRMLRKKTVETSTQVDEGALSVLGFNTSWCVDDACQSPDALTNIRDVTLDALLPSETQALVFQNRIGRAVSPNIEEDVSEIESSPYVITSQLSLNIIGLEHTNDSQDSKPAILLQASNPTHSTTHKGDDWTRSPSQSYSCALTNLPIKPSFSQSQFTSTREHTNKDTTSQPTREIFIQSVAAKENVKHGRNILVDECDSIELPRPKTPTPTESEELVLNENNFATFKYVLPTSITEVIPVTEYLGFEEKTTPMSWSSHVLPYENSRFLCSSPTEDAELPMYFTCSVVHTPCSSVPQTPDQEAEIILASNADRTTCVVDEAAAPLPDDFDSSFVLGATTSMLQNQATTSSSKGSSPDIQEYEVVQKDDSTATTSDGRKTTAQY